MDIEFQLIEISSPLQQGDIVEWLPDSFQPPWRAYGAVITGDCDLAWRKHCNTVCVVPIVPAMSLVETFLVPEELERLASRISDEACGLIARSKGDQTERLSHTALSDWLERCGPDGVVAELGPGPGQPPGSALAQLLEKLTAIGAALGSRTLATYVALLDGPLRADRKRISDRIRNYFASPPADVFFLSALSQHVDGGFFALLRFPQQVEESHIALDRGDIARRPVQCRRISRLQAPFVHRLTQMFAAVFADIGLPEWRKVAGREAADKIIQRIIGEP